MFGTNPIRSPLMGDGNLLEVESIFYTLQGEGPYAGAPAVFIRLGGCNLACDFCDTEFESFSEMTLKHVLSKVAEISPASHKPLIVLTGGEPLRQPVEALCQALLENGYKIQIETNGTLSRLLPEEVDIVCSPKNTGRGYFPIREDLLSRVKAFKFIISSSHSGYTQVPEVGQRKYCIPVYVQPMDEHSAEKNMANVAYTKELAMKHGYRLSLQLHKILGIP